MSVDVLGTILIVEDNKVNQLVGSKVLENLGYDFHHRQQRRGSRERLPVRSLRRRPHGLPDARDGRLRGDGRHSSVGGFRVATCRSSP